MAKKHGIYCSKPGNGICHQVQLERIGKPGKTLLGSDSHTPTGGALGMIAIGAGGLDVAVAMGGGAYYLSCPKVVGIKLTGKLQYGVAAKDIILELGGYEISCMNDLSRALRQFEAGDSVTIRVWRGGQEILLAVTLDEKPGT